MISNQKRSHSLRDYSSPYSMKLLKEATYLPQSMEEYNKAKDNLKIQKLYNQYTFKTFHIYIKISESSKNL